MIHIQNPTFISASQSTLPKVLLELHELVPNILSAMFASSLIDHLGLSGVSIYYKVLKVAIQLRRTIYVFLHQCLLQHYIATFQLSHNLDNWIQQLLRLHARNAEVVHL